MRGRSSSRSSSPELKTPGGSRSPTRSRSPKRSRRSSSPSLSGYSRAFDTTALWLRIGELENERTELTRENEILRRSGDQALEQQMKLGATLRRNIEQLEAAEQARATAEQARAIAEDQNAEMARKILAWQGRRAGQEVAQAAQSPPHSPSTGGGGTAQTGFVYHDMSENAKQKESSDGASEEGPGKQPPKRIYKSRPGRVTIKEVRYYANLVTTSDQDAYAGLDFSQRKVKFPESDKIWVTIIMTLGRIGEPEPNLKDDSNYMHFYIPATPGDYDKLESESKTAFATRFAESQLDSSAFFGETFRCVRNINQLRHFKTPMSQSCIGDLGKILKGLEYKVSAAKLQQILHKDKHSGDLSVYVINTLMHAVYRFGLEFFKTRNMKYNLAQKQRCDGLVRTKKRTTEKMAHKCYQLLPKWLYTEVATIKILFNLNKLDEMTAKGVDVIIPPKGAGEAAEAGEVGEEGQAGEEGEDGEEGKGAPTDGN